MANKLLSGKIEFIQYHKPGLMSGDYEVKIEQTIGDKLDGQKTTKKESGAGAASAKIPTETIFENTRKFTVAGPRFQLAPQDIYTVFPPPGSLGEHSNVLPHVIFNRSTLPWEREIWSGKDQPEEGESGSSASWLALLVFHQDDIEEGRVSQPKVMELKEVIKLKQGEKKKGPWKLDEHLKDSAAGIHNTAIPETIIGSDQHPEDKVTLIDVERALLEELRPSPADLDFLAHVRQRKTVSVDVDTKYKTSLKKCKEKETKTAKEVFAKANKGESYAEFREVLKKAGIRLSPQKFCSITSRKNGEKIEWVLTNTDNKKQFVARLDRGKDKKGKQIDVLNVFTNDAEVAIVVANRLPTPNGLSTVHLVSLEDRYNAEGEFQYGADAKANFARLVSLKQWSFSCTRPDRTFKEIIIALDKDTLRLKEPAGVTSEQSEILEKGYVPLRHYLRKGDKTVSWYHSPLLPWRNSERLYGLERLASAKPGGFPSASSEHGGWTFKGDDQYWVERSTDKKFRGFKVKPCFGSHPRVSDQLLRLDQASGIFDTTYAAAWKLGRLMALEDKRFSVALSNWKRTCAQHAHRFKQAGGDLHLHADEHPDLVSSLAPPPPEVSTWFDQRNILKGVPFNYLVPDSRMLPEESIRFFEVDPLWMDCLLDGAFSLGRVTEVDHRQDYQHIIADNRYPKMSGVLIRSEAVSGWPGMLVDAFYKLPSGVELFKSEDDATLTPDDVPKLRKALESIGLPLPREIAVKYSDDHESCIVNDLDTNPDYVDMILSAEDDPQLCLMMPDRDRQYHYTVINEGTEDAKELYLKLPLLRQERLGNGVLLCLFQGAVQRVDVHLKPETLHFGFKREDGKFWKELKQENGEEYKDENDQQLEGTTLEITDWKTKESESLGGGTLDIEATAAAMEKLLKIKATADAMGKLLDGEKSLKKITSAQFALQMIEGNELVRFTVDAPTLKNEGA
ncbi:hypothetical protein [Rubritalea profundi]|uniref:Uncharacterized protein n=1 Tax=Rubritalea profundi TaxID=1658618 RepID=A0A2S7U499_9BACT|nr:hypothetical protein [Rubritalea profundi]PQJ29845.1 hypothetical protein BSZ32_16055 [Rubritalea profundi]